ncbi:MAG: ATP-binding protein [Paracoccaceae bacterium]
MNRMRSLQARLAVGIGLLVTLLWIGAATLTANLLRHEIDEVFDATLQETAQRILPLAVMDIVGREEQGVSQRLAAIREHEELFTYVVRDRQRRILLRSHAADPAIFPPFDGTGFRQDDTYRFYQDAALRGSVTITVAEPLAHRRMVAREMQLGLGLPLLAVIPLSLAGIALGVRRSFGPVRRLRDALAARGARDLSPLGEGDLPSELVPVVGALNSLLERLKAAFEAERSFAANAAHELRTPLAGAIAQAQRLQAEAREENAVQRAAEIEATLKRLTRLSERLMQLARVEGGRLNADRPGDLRPVLQLVADDIRRAAHEDRIDLSLPEQPVLSDLDPDAFGILCRNLIENALRHGRKETVVSVDLTADGRLRVGNDCDPVPPEMLARLTERFERAAGAGEGSGLGLAIARTIADRAGGELTLRSPIPGRETGFEAEVRLPLVPPSA